MHRVVLLFTIFLFIAAKLSQAQMPGMNAMENSVGFVSSGTSVEPETTSESAPMIHRSFGNWTLLFHANGFLVDTQQTGPRGRDKLYSTNWLMPMLSRDFGRQTVTFRTMFSLEPATVTRRQYPELFQAGEIAYGVPIVDGQHPHDFVMELAGRYDFHLRDTSNLFIYGGPLAEPALGPTAYSHRASASENPVATLGHHQEDSTHLSLSVITLGFVQGPVQLEASTFHGQEPDERRWNIDTGKPDSFSSRLTMRLTKNFSGQFSIGRINHREALEPDLSTLRATASINHNVRFSKGHISSSLIWGRNNDVSGQSTHIFNSYTAESTINFANRNWLWTRIENVDREVSHARIQVYTFGYERDLPVGLPFLNIGVGAQATLYGMPSQLNSIYGDNPAGFTVFLHVRPAGNMAAHMQMMHQH